MDDQMMAIALMYPNPDQPRREFDEATLEELAASITEYGVLEPLLVTPRGSRYLIIAGERRYRASKIAGLDRVPCRVMEADDALVEEIALLENVQRQDLNIMEEARGYHALLMKGNTPERLASRLGKSPRCIRGRASLMLLEPDIQKLAVSGAINASEATELARVPAHRQAEVAKRILSGELRSRSNNKMRDFVNGLIRLEEQDYLFGFQLASPLEKKSLSDFEHVLHTVEQFINTITDGTINQSTLKKAVFHSTVTTQRLDLAILQLIKIRRLVTEGEGVQSAMGVA